MMPSTNIAITEIANATPRSRLLRRKCPPPGISHAARTAGAHFPAGAGAFVTFSATISFYLTTDVRPGTFASGRWRLAPDPFYSGFHADFAGCGAGATALGALATMGGKRNTRRRHSRR